MTDKPVIWLLAANESGAVLTEVDPETVLCNAQTGAIQRQVVCAT